MSKVLILKDNSSSFEYFFVQNMIKNDVDVDNMSKKYRSKYDLRNIVYVMCKRLMLSNISSLWFNSWKKKVNEYDAIIIFDVIIRKVLVKWLRKVYHGKIILWYWNIPTNIGELNYYKEHCDFVTCFDKDVCLKYDLEYIHQFYIPMKYNEDIKVEYDLIYIGADKNRKELLQDFITKTNKKNFKKKIILVNELIREYVDEYGIEYKSTQIDYEDIIKLDLQSKVIMEINLSEQTGITLRSLESIFYRKKLITNNKHIVEYDFYNKNNIFVLGIDSMERIDEFINSEYVEVPDEVLNNYSYEDWLKKMNDLYI